VERERRKKEERKGKIEGEKEIFRDRLLFRSVVSKKRGGKCTRGTKPQGNQNIKEKSWKLYDYLAVAAQVQALPPVLSHLELDLRENMSFNNHAGLSGKTFSRDRRYFRSPYSISARCWHCGTIIRDGHA